MRGTHHDTGSHRVGEANDTGEQDKLPPLLFHQAMRRSLPVAMGLTLARNGGRGVVMAGADGPGVPEKGRGEGEGGTKEGRGGLEVRASSSPLASLSSLLLSPSEWARARPRPPRDGGAYGRVRGGKRKDVGGLGGLGESGGGEKGGVPGGLWRRLRRRVCWWSSCR